MSFLSMQNIQFSEQSTPERKAKKREKEEGEGGCQESTHELIPTLLINVFLLRWRKPKVASGPRQKKKI